jgi:N-acetylglucosamine malate deacetylase 1
MVFSPHPDDAEFGMGGTMIRMVHDGLSVLHVALTPSQMSTHGDIHTRRGEFEAAAKLIGADSLMLDFMDTEVENDAASRKKIAALIRQHKPKIVFAPYHTNPLADIGGLVHRDHFTSGALIRDAIKLARLEKTVPNIPKHTITRSFFYMIPRNVMPSIIVDITPVIDKYKELILCYKSQMAINVRGVGVQDALLIGKRSIGLTSGYEYGEQFVTEMPLNFNPNDFLRP